MQHSELAYSACACVFAIRSFQANEDLNFPYILMRLKLFNGKCVFLCYLQYIYYVLKKKAFKMDTFDIAVLLWNWNWYTAPLLCSLTPFSNKYSITRSCCQLLTSKVFIVINVCQLASRCESIMLISNSFGAIFKCQAVENLECKKNLTWVYGKYSIYCT